MSRAASGPPAERFLSRVWHLARAPAASTSPECEDRTILAATIDQVTRDSDDMRFNTAIAALMTLVGRLRRQQPGPSGLAQRTLVELLAPFAPHMTEELWHRSGGNRSVHVQPWPTPDTLTCGR